MFKQIKSAFFLYYLYKFRRKVLIIAFLLLLAIFANSIYGDMVEYLTLKEKLQYLEIVLLAKWGIIIFSILISIFIIISMFKPSPSYNNYKKSFEKNKNNDTMSDKITENNQKFTQREEKFLKKKLRSKADLLLEKDS